MSKTLCIILIFGMFVVPVTSAQSRWLDTKTQGKLSLIILLSGLAVLTKLLVDKDKKAGEALHARLGMPEQIIEFQRGFDHWRVEWYIEQRYLFRNGVLQQSLEINHHER